MNPPPVGTTHVGEASWSGSEAKGAVGTGLGTEVDFDDVVSFAS